MWPSAAPTTTPILYPQLVISSHTTAASSATVNLRMTLAGYVYCAAYSSSSSTPTGSEIKSIAYPVTATTSPYTANVTVSGLSAFTAYDVYCYTEDTSSPANPLPDSLVAATKTAVNTTCCYSLTLPTLPTSLYERKTSSILTASSPVSGVGLRLNFTYCAAFGKSLCTADAITTALRVGSSNCTTFTAPLASVNMTVSPSAQHLLSKSASFTLYPSLGGCYGVNYTITGAASSLFYPPSLKPLYVLYTGEARSGPAITSAQFDSTGSSIIVSFDSDTDQAGLSSGTFACGKLLNFTGASSTTCAWTSRSVVTATLTSKSTILPSDNVTLHANVLKAKCSSKTGCASWPYSTAGTTAVTKPSSPLVPVPVLVYSASLGNCSDLKVDGSSSTGSGGRAMAYYWTVRQDRGADTGNLTGYMDSINRGGSTGVLTIPNRYLKAATYDITLTLTNFLSVSAASPTASVVMGRGKGLPYIEVTPTISTIKRTEALSLFAKASISKCSGAKTLSYNWTESKGSIRFASLDPRYLRVAPNTLSVGKTYNFTVNVTDSNSNWNAQTVRVSVVASSLVVKVAGGDRVVGTGTSLTLDGSGSYDPDDLTSSMGGLNLTWSCVKGGDEYGKACGLGSTALIAMANKSAKPSLGYLVAGTYIFTLTAAKDTRTGTASMTIYVVAGTPPAVSVSTSSTTKVNPSGKLTVYGSVQLFNTSGATNTTLRWSLQSGTLASSAGATLASAANSVLTRSIRGLTTGTIPFNLILSSNSLGSRSTYVLRLTAFDNSASSTTTTSYAEVSFSTNSPPTSGSLVAAPEYGNSLQTDFTLTASSWVDDSSDYPFTYSFTYKLIDATSSYDASSTSSVAEYVLLASTYYSSVDGVYLPEGVGSAHNLTVRVAVTDLYGASGKADLMLRVRPAQFALSALSGNVTSLLSSAFSTSNTDAAFQIITAAAGAINSGSACTDVTLCQSIRSSLLSSVSQAVNLQDPTPAVVQQQASILMKLTASSSQITGSAQTTAASLINTVASAGISTGISANTAGALTNAISSMLDTDMSSSPGGGRSSIAKTLSISVDNLVSASWVNLSPGENPMEVSSSNLNASSAKVYASDTMNKTMTPPGTTSTLDMPTEGVTAFFPAAEDDDEISTGILSLADVHRSNKSSLTSSIVRFKLQTSGNASSAASSSSSSSRRRRQLLSQTGVSSVITVQSSGAQAGGSQVTETVSITCASGESGRKSASCSTGAVFNHTCNGTAITQQYHCASENSSMCAVWDSSSDAWDSSSCHVISIGTHQTTCKCYNLGASTTSSSIVLDFASVSTSLYFDFLETIRLAAALNPYVILGSLVVFITIGIILQGGAFLCLAGYRKDVLDARSEAEKADGAGQLSDDPNTADTPGLLTSKSEIVMLDESLPRFAKAQTFWELMCDEMARRHDWFSIVMVYSRAYSRAYRIAIVITTTITQMFVTAVLYSVTNPTGNCTTHPTEDECMSETYFYDSSRTYCEWLPKTSQCIYQQANDTNYVMTVIIAVVSNMITVPINLLIAIIFNRLVLPAVVSPELAQAKRRNSVAELSASYIFNNFGDPGTASSPDLYQTKRRRSSISQVLLGLFHAPNNNNNTSQSASAAYSLPAGQPRARGGGGEEDLPPQLQLSIRLEGQQERPPQQQPQQQQQRRRHSLVDTLKETVPDMESVKETFRRIERMRENKQLRAYQEKKAFQTFLDAETCKMIMQATEQRKELCATIKLFKEAENALQQRLVYGSESSAGATTRLTAEMKEKLEKQASSMQDKIKVLRAFRRDFDKKWNFDEEGNPRPPTTWEQFTGMRFFRRLRKRVKADIKMASKIETQLLAMPKQHREIRLLEYQRMDFLSPTERRIYAHNMIEFVDREPKEPISIYWKALGWLLVIMINVGFGFYVTLFGIRQGSETTNSWLSSFVASMLQDPMLNLPLAIMFYNVYLPMHIKHKLIMAIDGASDAPFVFKAFIPPGPASRVAMKHPEWAAGQVIRRVLTPTPGAVDLKPKDAFRYDPNVGIAFKAQFMSRFRYNGEAMKSTMLVGSLTMLSVFTLLPEKAQDAIVSYLIAALTGGLLLGFTILQSIRWWLAVMSAALLMFMIFVFALSNYMQHEALMRQRKQAAVAHRLRDVANKVRILKKGVNAWDTLSSSTRISPFDDLSGVGGSGDGGGGDDLRTTTGGLSRSRHATYREGQVSPEVDRSGNSATAYDDGDRPPSPDPSQAPLPPRQASSMQGPDGLEAMPLEVQHEVLKKQLHKIQAALQVQKQESAKKVQGSCSLSPYDQQQQLTLRTRTDGVDRGPAFGGRGMPPVDAIRPMAQRSTQRLDGDARQAYGDVVVMPRSQPPTSPYDGPPIQAVRSNATSGHHDDGCSSGGSRSSLSPSYEPPGGYRYSPPPGWDQMDPRMRPQQQSQAASSSSPYDPLPSFEAERGHFGPDGMSMRRPSGRLTLDPLEPGTAAGGGRASSPPGQGGWQAIQQPPPPTRRRRSSNVRNLEADRLSPAPRFYSSPSPDELSTSQRLQYQFNTTSPPPDQQPQWHSLRASQRLQPDQQQDQRLSLSTSQRLVQQYGQQHQHQHQQSLGSSQQLSSQQPFSITQLSTSQKLLSSTTAPARRRRRSSVERAETAALAAQPMVSGGNTPSPSISPIPSDTHEQQLRQVSQLPNRIRRSSLQLSAAAAAAANAAHQQQRTSPNPQPDDAQQPEVQQQPTLRHTSDPPPQRMAARRTRRRSSAQQPTIVTDASTINTSLPRSTTSPHLHIQAQPPMTVPQQMPSIPLSPKSGQWVSPSQLSSPAEPLQSPPSTLAEGSVPPRREEGSPPPSSPPWRFWGSASPPSPEPAAQSSSPPPLPHQQPPSPFRPLASPPLPTSEPPLQSPPQSPPGGAPRGYYRVPERYQAVLQHLQQAPLQERKSPSPPPRMEETSRSENKQLDRTKQL